MLYYGRMYDEDAQKQLGYLVDITEHGFMLLCEEPIAANETLHIKLELTLDISKGPWMYFTAKSLWCEPDIDPNHYNCGFEIIDIKPEDLPIIRDIISAYGFRDNQMKTG